MEFANHFSLSPITPLRLADGISYPRLLTGYCGQQRSQVSNQVNGILFYLKDFLHADWLIFIIKQRKCTYAFDLCKLVGSVTLAQPY